MIDKYARAYTEVLEILSHFSEEEYYKIPKEKIEFYANNKDNNYEFTINPEADLSQQYISEEANAILISLFRDYFATENQKETLKNLLKQNQERLEEIKKEEYSQDNLFKKKDTNIKINKSEVQEQSLIKYKEPLWKKIFNMILQKIKLK